VFCKGIGQSPGPPCRAPRASPGDRADHSSIPYLLLAVTLALSRSYTCEIEEGTASQTAVVGETPSPRDSVLSALSRYGHGFGDSRATVQSRLGAPRHVDTIVATNGTDTLYLLEYAGASFLVHRWTAAKREILPEIRIWESQPDMASVPRLGQTTRAALVAMVGASNYRVSTAADSTVLKYQWFGPDSELIEFYFVQDTLRLIRLRFYMG
jgi:hypothetical protein